MTGSTTDKPVTFVGKVPPDVAVRADEGARRVKLIVGNQVRELDSQRVRSLVLKLRGALRVAETRLND